MSLFVAAQILIINNHMTGPGWKTQSQAVDRAIGRLTPKEIAQSKEIHADLFPYLSAFHVSWLFETCWADPGYDEEPPENFNPDIPLNRILRWALGDPQSRR